MAGTSPAMTKFSIRSDSDVVLVIASNPGRIASAHEGALRKPCRNP
jgi:hypothetical protein